MLRGGTEDGGQRGTDTHPNCKKGITGKCLEFETLNSETFVVFRNLLFKCFWKNLNDHLHAFNCVKSKKQKTQRLSLACLNQTTNQKAVLYKLNSLVTDS